MKQKHKKCNRLGHRDGHSRDQVFVPLGEDFSCVLPGAERKFMCDSLSVVSDPNS